MMKIKLKLARFVEKTFNYRPLPKGLTIQQSKIDGQGLFSKKLFGAGECFGLTHQFLNKKHQWVRTPLGGFINHSETPNCFINNEGSQRVLYSVRHIKKNEELTVYYRLENYGR